MGRNEVPSPFALAREPVELKGRLGTSQKKDEISIRTHASTIVVRFKQTKETRHAI